MNDADLCKIEVSIGARLPESYRQFMQKYTEDLLQIAGDFEFITEADCIVKLNEDLRKMPFYQGKSWPDRLFAIGENGCEDYYFLDLKDSTGAVLFVNHETMNHEIVAPNVEEWVQKLLKELRP